MLARNIDEVIALLDRMISITSQASCPIGYFPVLYKKVTLAIKEAIAHNLFDDCQRMEKLNVIFANRYFSAYNLFQRGQQPPQSWSQAFETAHNSNATVLQHLLLSINAHINYDLGVAAAQVAPGIEIETLKTDFYRINTILFGLIEGFQKELNRVSPIIGLCNTFARKQDTRLAISNLKRVRDSAWQFALAYAKANPEKQAIMLKERDEYTAWVAQDIRKPVWILMVLIQFIKAFEGNNEQQNILVLNGPWI